MAISQLACEYVHFFKARRESAHERLTLHARFTAGFWLFTRLLQPKCGPKENRAVPSEERRGALRSMGMSVSYATRRVRTGLAQRSLRVCGCATSFSSKSRGDVAATSAPIDAERKRTDEERKRADDDRKEFRQQQKDMDAAYQKLTTKSD